MIFQILMWRFFSFLSNAIYMIDSKKILIIFSVFFSAVGVGLVGPGEEAVAGNENNFLTLVLPAIFHKAVAPGELSVVRNGDILTVRSNKSPSWKVDFAIGSGAPGGGLATGLYVPADSPESIVEDRPFRSCCSAVGLDNLEWRWREFGGSAGTRASLGLNAQVTGFTILENSPQKVVFSMIGSWNGVSDFLRTTTITPDGFTTTVRAAYAGTTGKDSMWWIISLFRPDRIYTDQVTVMDHDTPPVPLSFTPGSIRSLPTGITLPYRFEFPLKFSQQTSIFLDVINLAEPYGNPDNYEYWDKDSMLGGNYMFYPRWQGSFQNITYTFTWKWRFTPMD